MMTTSAMPSTRRQFLSTLAAGAPALLGQAARRPNVLFILADEWRAQATGYNGDPNVRAPVLDRLASQSISFDTAVSEHRSAARTAPAC